MTMRKFFSTTLILGMLLAFGAIFLEIIRRRRLRAGRAAAHTG